MKVLIYHYQLVIYQLLKNVMVFQEFIKYHLFCYNFYSFKEIKIREILVINLLLNYLFIIFKNFIVDYQIYQINKHFFKKFKVFF